MNSSNSRYLAACSASYDSSFSQIYKLNPSDFTLQKMLPDNVTCTGFTVTDNGFIVYWNGVEQQQNCRIKCPGGSIYPVADTYTFILNGTLYSIRENQIVKYETIGNNEIKEKMVCTIPTANSNWNFTPNYVRHTMLINGMLEFDGKQCVELEKYVHIGDIRTSKAWYTLSNITFSKIAMQDYRETQFRVSEYEIQSISANAASPNITFTGFRYSDGANVVGTITESDKIVIDNVSDNGEKIINLIPLN